MENDKESLPKSQTKDIATQSEVKSKANAARNLKTKDEPTKRRNLKSAKPPRRLYIPCTGYHNPLVKCNDPECLYPTNKKGYPRPRQTIVSPLSRTRISSGFGGNPRRTGYLSRSYSRPSRRTRTTLGFGGFSRRTRTTSGFGGTSRRAHKSSGTRTSSGFGGTTKR